MKDLQVDMKEVEPNELKNKLQSIDTRLEDIFEIYNRFSLKMFQSFPGGS
jgi:hypothetical protein